MSTIQPIDAAAAERARTRVTLLGTSGGPPWWDDDRRAGISTAIKVEDAVYLIDCGEGWGPRFRQAGLGPSGFQRGLDDMRAVFLTHHHSDHTIDYPNLLLLAWHNGADRLARPIQIFGPGDRRVLPPIFDADAREVQPAVWNPASPTPGIVESTQRLLEGYATDINDRMRDNAKQDLRQIFTVRDIQLPGGAGRDPNGDPSPAMDPFAVYEDELVKVSAILVDHRPVFPAFAFRFDTADASIVISGDTGVCDNLVTLAKGADLLLHEVIDLDWVDALLGPDSAVPDENLKQHMLAAHTSIGQVGVQAQLAQVGALALTHIVPGYTSPEKLLTCAADFDGPVFVGEDLMNFGFGSRG